LVLLGMLLWGLFGQMRHAFQALAGSSSSMAYRASEPPLEEVVLEARGGDDKILVVDIVGIISSGLFDGEGNMVARVEHQFKRAARAHDVKAVILRVNSPGGEVLASDDIYRVIEEFQRKTEKPVVASMGSVAASGGYYVSAPCAWIVANELTITGSIGVIMHGYNYRGLMDKVGVRPQVYKSGRFKDMMSGDKAPEEILPEERQMVQSLVDNTFQRFKEVIAQGRKAAQKRNDGKGRALTNEWESLADGRVLSGKEAFEAGFVDELGTFKQAVERAQRLAGIEDADLIQYQEPFHLGNLFRLLGKTETGKLKLDLGVDLPRMQAGLLYYLFLPGGL
jgi:protease-4